MEPVSLWMITAHLIGDFPLQPSWMARKKTWYDAEGDERIDGITTLALHVIIHGFLFLPIAFYTLPTMTHIALFMVWVVGTHAIIDSRRWIEPKEGWGHDGMTWVWLNDQIIHLASLSLAYPVVIALL